MKASDARPFIGKLVTYRKGVWPFPHTGVVKSVTGRNIIMEDDALWAPDITDMKLVEAPTVALKESDGNIVNMSKYTGNDNYGRPKVDYLAKLAGMDDDALGSECYNMIYQSARCNNNPRADWHWMVDACYAEAARRDKSNIYSNALLRGLRELNRKNRL